MMCFNSRTHAGCDSRKDSFESVIAVSIHAPTRGATGEQTWYNFKLTVSIHAPTRGATYTCANLQSVGKWFQFTHPRGVRQKTINGFKNEKGFNSRTHAGCDCNEAPNASKAASFNSRTHAGCDISYSLHVGAIPCFNSRTHAGCDRLLQPIKYGNYVSIHAPTRGATNCKLSRYPALVSFNSRTHAGCDFASQTGNNSVARFQFTHPRGVRRGKGGN